ncbi:MAG: hypothetical protein J2P21_23715 [Chloracidobacterium sp.]|nr:hypothetical protein [Chloracidobacterium sp.]
MINFTTSNQITLTARVWPEEDGFVSLCIENGGEALEMLAEQLNCILRIQPRRWTSERRIEL